MRFGSEELTLEEQKLVRQAGIEGRWRGLSDDERMSLIAMCCVGCGQITKAQDGSPPRTIHKCVGTST